MPLKATQPGLLLGFCILLLAIIGSASLYLWDPLPLQVIRNNTFDQFQRIQPRPYQDTAVKIINIDEESLNRLGQWPWPRTLVAELLAKLQAAEPAAIALDIIFAEKDRTSPQAMLDLWQLPANKRQLLDDLPDHDQILATAIQQSNTTLGFALTHDKSQQPPPTIKAHFIEIGTSPLNYLPSFASAVSSLPMLEAHAAGNGALTFISDTDGVVRKVPLLLRYQDKLVPSLAAECLRLAQKTKNFTLRNHTTAGMGLAEVGIGSIRVPTTPQGEIWINFSKPTNQRYISAWQVLAGRVDEGDLHNKILLIGTSAQGLMDLRFSPLGDIIPGIEVHAQALEQILSGVQLIQPDWSNALEILIITLGGLLIGSIALSSGAMLSFVAFIFALSLLWTSAWHAYADYRLLIDPMVSSVMLLLIFLLTSIFRHVYSERSQRWVKQAFSRYISPNLVEYLITHPEELELGGHRQTCSFVFTDLTDFTSLMENLDPSQAVSLLNAYLENMIAIAFSHHGTLDRIVGDAVAIMFSAPVKQADHQRRAIQCALDMQRYASLYSAQLNNKNIRFGLTRIGVHSGEVIVGNFGGKTIFDYRALGDAVNTASRLEGANKYIGTLICISEATLSACPEIPARPIGRLLVKGKSIPLTVFEPLGQQQSNLSDYQAAFILMREQQTEAAIAAFKTIVANHPNDTLAAFHLRRLQDGNSGDLIELHNK